jgi:hypothetical protein
MKIIMLNHNGDHCTSVHKIKSMIKLVPYKNWTFTLKFSIYILVS